METLRFIVCVLVTLVGIGVAISVVTLLGLIGAVLGSILIFVGIVCLIAYAVKEAWETSEEKDE